MLASLTDAPLYPSYIPQSYDNPVLPFAPPFLLQEAYFTIVPLLNKLSLFLIAQIPTLQLFSVSPVCMIDLS